MTYVRLSTFEQFPKYQEKCKMYLAPNCYTHVHNDTIFNEMLADR